MLKGFRKRFILLNMVLTGIVIGTVLVSVGLYIAHGYVLDIEFTMEQVLKSHNDGHDHRGERDESVEATTNNRAEPADEPLKDEKPDQSDKPPLYNRNVVCALYCKTRDTVRVTDNDGEAEAEVEEVEACVRAALEADEDFGILEEWGFFYSKAESQQGCNVALLDVRYLIESVFALVLILCLIFCTAMGIFLLINLYTSKMAMKPLERSIELEKQFVCDVSHEMKTPLTVILANSSILKESDGLPFESQLKWIDSTETAAKDMLSMINEMLTLSTLDEGGYEPGIERTELSSLVTRAALQMESVAYDGGIAYDVSIVPDVYINTDPGMCQKVLLILIDNALKYEPRGGSVAVTLSVQKKRATVGVKNKSAYISEESLPHIFERFYREDSSRGLKKGHGLGLSVAKKSVELLGGALFVESSKKGGTLFKVTFPLSEEG